MTGTRGSGSGRIGGFVETATTDQNEVMSAVVPLVTPATTQLRAGAVWVTISNWADELALRYGGAEILTPAGGLDPAATRRAAFPTATASIDPVSDSAPPSVGSGAAARGLQDLARTAAKDLRWAYWSWDAWRRIRTVDVERYRGAPFVWQHHDLFERPGFELADRLGVPLVLFVDAPQVWEATAWGVRRPYWGRALERVAEIPQFRRAEVVACVSEEVADAVSELTDGAARVLVTPCTATRPAATDRVADRERLGLGDRVVVGWVGSFRRFHHADLLVRSVHEVSDHHPGVTLVMIGDGPTRPECQRLADELGLDARFVGSVPNDEVPALLGACDIGVVPSGPGDSFHYSPLKLKEYLAAGLATVAPAAGEMARQFEDGVETLLYPPGDLPSMTRCLGQLVADEHLRRRVAASGQQRLDQSFSLGAQLDAVEAALGIATTTSR